MGPGDDNTTTTDGVDAQDKRSSSPQSSEKSSSHNAAIVFGFFLVIAILFVLVIVLINYLQANHKHVLPDKLQNWHFLPEPLRSVQPYKRFLRKFSWGRMCLGDPDDEQLIYRRNEDLENNAL